MGFVALILMLTIMEEPAAKAQADRITIRAGRTFAPVSPLLFGQNYGTWVNTSPPYVAMYQ